MLAIRPLLAADWIEIVIFLFIVISSLIGQAYKAVQQQQRQKPKRAVRPPVQAVPPAQRKAAGEVVAEAERPKSSIEREIEAFLRKSLGQPEAKPKPAAQQAGKSKQRGGPAAKQPPAKQPPAPPRRLVRTEPLETEARSLAAESVAEHVERHIQRGGVVQRDAHLGEQLAQADERLESHLQDVFQHRLGTLAGDEGRPESAVDQGTDAGVWAGRRSANPIAMELHELLSNPQKLQAAIVISEILRRPDDRWD
jgi:hypothetical protein